MCKIVGSGDGSPENAQESSKVEASKQAEVIEPAEEAVEAVHFKVHFKDAGHLFLGVDPAVSTKTSHYPDRFRL